MIEHIVIWQRADASPEKPWVTPGPRVEQCFPNFEEAEDFFEYNRLDPNWKLLFWVTCYKDGTRQIQANYGQAHIIPQPKVDDLRCVKCGGSILDMKCPPTSVDP